MARQKPIESHASMRLGEITILRNVCSSFGERKTIPWDSEKNGNNNWLWQTTNSNLYGNYTWNVFEISWLKYYIIIIGDGKCAHARLNKWKTFSYPLKLHWQEFSFLRFRKNRTKNTISFICPHIFQAVTKICALFCSVLILSVLFLWDRTRSFFRYSRVYVSSLIVLILKFTINRRNSKLAELHVQLRVMLHEMCMQYKEFNTILRSKSDKNFPIISNKMWQNDFFDKEDANETILISMEMSAEPNEWEKQNDEEWMSEREKKRASKTRTIAYTHKHKHPKMYSSFENLLCFYSNLFWSLYKIGYCEACFAYWML